MRYYVSAGFYYFLLYPLSLLPLPILYGIAKGLSWFFFHVAGYRKKVVMQNIRRAFPEKTEAQINQIGKQFYDHLCTMMVESLKSFSMSKAELLRHVHYTGLEPIAQMAREGRSVILIAGHRHNYEWLVTGINAVFEHQVVALYRPLNNPFFEKKIKESRAQLGMQLESIHEIKERFADQLKQQPLAAVFAMDQSPSNPNSAYWLPFLNQDTPVLYGTEKYAKEYDLPIFYAHLSKPRTGYYVADFKLLTDTPRQTTYGEITQKMMQWLEADIKADPAPWLWSHKRWKHQRPTKGVNASATI
ncbi:MAG: lysophospholipid acyltransferase family protein [Runella sp.]